MISEQCYANGKSNNHDRLYSKYKNHSEIESNLTVNTLNICSFLKFMVEKCW